MCQWSRRGRFDCFQFACGGRGRTPHFLRDAGFWTFFRRAPFVWQSLALVHARQWLHACVSLRLLLEESRRFHVKVLPEPFALEIWTTSTCSLYGGGIDAIFRSPPRGVESWRSADFLEPLIANSCWSSSARLHNLPGRC